MNLKTAKIIRTLLLVVACIAFLVGLVQSNIAGTKRSHNPDKIKVEITSCESKYDNTYYYVYTDFTIENNTSATLSYVEVVTYFKDQNGKIIGTMNSQLGSSYGSGSGLNIAAGETGIKETYLSEYQSSSSYSNLFIELYNHGLSNVTITYEITNAVWSDGYRYYKGN